MSGIKKVPGWDIQSNFKFTKYRLIGSEISSALVSIFINYIDNMLLTQGQIFYYPQFLIKQYPLSSESKYFPQVYPQISKYIQVLKSTQPIDHDIYAKDINQNSLLISEFQSLSQDFTSKENFSIDSFCKNFSQDLNVQIRVYSTEGLVYRANENSYTEALVLSILYFSDDNKYGVLYNENYKVFCNENHNLDYWEFKKERLEPSQVQVFDDFFNETLGIISRDLVPEAISNELKEFYFRLKKISYKFWGFEEKLKLIGKV